jgi:hypothetical protein
MRVRTGERDDLAGIDHNRHAVVRIHWPERARRQLARPQRPRRHRGTATCGWPRFRCLSDDRCIFGLLCCVGISANSICAREQLKASTSNWNGVRIPWSRPTVVGTLLSKGDGPSRLIVQRPAPAPAQQSKDSAHTAIIGAVAGSGATGSSGTAGNTGGGPVGRQFQRINVTYDYLIAPARTALSASQVTSVTLVKGPCEPVFAAIEVHESR